MKRRLAGWVVLAALAASPVWAQSARLIPGTGTELPRLVTKAGKTYKLGKKPYPAGTRNQWIAEGKVLAKTPAGILPTGKKLKGAADNRSYMPPIGDQGYEGSCVHWAGTYYTKTANMKRNDPSINVNAASNQCSPRFTYNLTNAGEDSGGYGHEPFEVFMRYGVASLAQKPYDDEQFVTLPVAADFVEGLHRRSTNYVWLWDWAPDAGQIAELKAWLDDGRIAACGVNAETSFDAWGPGDAPWVGDTGTTLNDINHMVTVCGYGEGYYLVANSWDTSFGSNGYIVVDSDYFENYFSDVIYPVEGTYEPATDYAKLTVRHGTRSDIQELEITANGETVWNHSPLPKDMPIGDPSGVFVEDTRDNLDVAIDLTQVVWGEANVVTARVRDAVSAMNGTVTVFAVTYDGVEYDSPSVPVPVTYNTDATAGVRLYQSTDTNVCFTSYGASVNEGSGLYEVTVYKTQASGDVGGQIVLSGTATEGADYTVSSTNFTMNGATTSATFTVTLIDDEEEELSETIVMTLANVTGGIVQAPDVFTLTLNPSDLTGGSIVISQYTETDTGTSPKGIEIWNASASPVTFDGGANLLDVKVGMNGGAPASVVQVDSGTLAAGDVMVIGTPDMSPDVEEAFSFNGNDSIAVELGGVVQDVIGTPGVDPSSAWEGNGVSTANQNIQLKLGITFGEPNGWTDPSERFEFVAVGSDLTGFGEPPGGFSDLPPVLAPIGSQFAITNQNLSFVVSAEDAVDNDSIVLSAGGLPAGAVFAAVTNAGTVSNTFVWNNVGPVGTYTVTFTATDKDGSDSEEVVITIGDGTEPIAIVFQGFEGSPADTWTITDIDPNLVSSSTGTGDTPANQRVRTGSYSWQPGQGEYTTESMELGEVDISQWSDVVLTLHLSATTTEIGDNCGMWPEDNISFSLALDGNEYPAAADMTVAGNTLMGGSVTGALWGFTATGVAATTAGVARTVSPASGGVTDDGIATVQIALPPGTASVKLKADVVQEYAGYYWNMDDVSLTGFNDGGASDFPPTLSVSPDGLEKAVGVSNNLSFTISASEIPNDSGDEVRIWATGLPAGAAFAGATNTGSASSVFNWTPDTAGTYPVSFFAGDKDGTNQVDVTVTVYEGGGGTYAVVVGLNEYSPSYGAGSLSGCVPDANHIHTNIIKRGEWNPLSVTKLLDSAATKTAIRAAIANYAATAVAGDTFFYFQSSHGGQNSGTSVFLCSHDANYEDTELAEDLSAFATGVKVVVMVDACHSGGLFKSVEDGTLAVRISKSGWNLAGIVSRIMDEQRAAKLAAGIKGVETRVSSSEIGWITAADYDQYSWDGGPNGGGVFTDKVIEGWTNNPPYSCDLNSDNYANFWELYDYSWDVANTADYEYTKAMAHNTNVLLATIAGWVGDEAPGGLIVFSNMTAQTVIVGDTLEYPVGAYTAGTNVPVTVTMNTVEVGASYADGELTFTPAADGAYTFQFTGTNANGGSATASLSVTATLPAPTLADPAATAIGNDRFTANWNAVAGAASYLLDVATTNSFSGGSGGADVLTEDFATLTDTAVPDGWTTSGTSGLDYTGDGYYGEASPAYKFGTTGQWLQSPAFATGATNLQFWALGNNGSGSTLAISGLVNSVWTLVDTVSVAEGPATYNVPLASQTTQLSFHFTKVVNCGLDDLVVQAGDAGSSELILSGQSVPGTSYEVTGLDMDTTYYFRVRAVGNLAGPNSETGSATTTATDTPPSFDPISAQSATVGVPFSLDVSAYDSGYPAPVLSLVSSTAAGGDYGFTGGMLSFTPSEPGTFEFVFQASNTLGTALATVDVAVASAPVYIPVAGIDDLASTSFTVNWTPCTGATDYQVQVATNAEFSAGGTEGNLMENGGFESGDSTGWDKFEADYAVVATDPQEGTYHVTCSAGGTRDLMQAVEITGDGVTEYEVSFWYKKPDAAGNARIWSSWADGGQVSGDSLQPTTYLQAAAEWTKVTYLVVPLNGSNILNFEVRTYNGATVLWDNFFVGLADRSRETPRALVADETVSALTYPVSGLTPETLYYARVRMTGGDWSETVSATTLSAGPAAPSFAAIPAQQASVGVPFSLDVSVYDSGNPVPVLSLESSTAASEDYSFSAGTLSFTPSTAGEFEFVFLASNELGTAMATATVTAASSPVLIPVAGIDNVASHSFTVNWTPCTGATDYQVQVATDDAFSTGGGGVATDLFISEYIEGSSNNKVIEIFNGTGSAVDLGTGGYALRLYANGSTSPSSITLSGTVADGDVFVVANSTADAGVLAVADMTSGGLTHNGNDVVALAKNDANIDVVGTIGSDTDFAKDVTKVRKSAVSAGVTTYDPLEWDDYAVDTFSYLGSHTFAGGGGTGGSIIVDETRAALTYPVTGLDPETPYWVRVRMTGGDWSAVVSETTLAEGGTPTPDPVPISQPVPSGEGMAMQIQTTAGVTYVLQYTTDLLNGTWQQADSEEGTGFEVELDDADPADAQRFYRVVRP